MQDYINEKKMATPLSPETIALKESRLHTYLSKRVDPTFGHVPETKPDGVHPLLCANINNISTTKVKNFKADQIRAIHHKYGINGLLMCEHGLRMSQLKPSETLQKLLALEGSTS